MSKKIKMKPFKIQWDNKKSVITSPLLLVFWGSIVTTICAMCFIGGCSPTQQAWAERGKEGINIAVENITQFYSELKTAEDLKFETFIKATYQDIVDCKAGKLINPTTGKPVEMTDKWLEANQKALVAGLKVWMARKEKIAEDYRVAISNLLSTQECFTKMQELNRAWASSESQIAAQLDRLTAQMAQLKNNQNK